MHPLRAVVLAGLLALLPCLAAAQDGSVQLNGFGHLEFTANRSENTDLFFTMGEHALFVRAQQSDRFSFLAEATVRFDGPSGGYRASVERALMRVQYAPKHAVIVGKVHSPVNYWNDAFHHGRIFFPTIDRPFAFSHLVPLHTLGVQAQGRGLGTARAGYDAMVGNGISSSDASAEGGSLAALGRVFVEPVTGLHFGASYYYNFMPSNGYGVHSGHNMTAAERPADVYAGPLAFHLASLSVAWMGGRTEFLHELSFNRSVTDSLGAANNTSAFVFLGHRVSERVVPYVFADWLRVAENDLHVYPEDERKSGIGVRLELAALVSLKAQVEYLERYESHLGGLVSHSHRSEATRLRLQLAYGF